MSFIALHEDMLAIWRAAVTSARMTRLLWFVGLAVIALALLVNYWIAFAMLPLLFGIRYFGRRKRESYMWLSALMLSYEMLVSNLGGLGDRFPEAYWEASTQFIGHEFKLDAFLGHLPPSPLQNRSRNT